jgi:hypothetical protein
MAGPARFARALGGLAAVAGLSAALFAPSIARAHVDLTLVEPASGLLGEPPTEVALTFSGPLDVGNHLQLLDPAGVPVDGVASRVDTTNRTRLLGTLPFIEYGTYTLAYKSVSQEDGHEQFGFVPLVWGGATSLAASVPERDPAADLRDIDLQLDAVPTEWGDMQWHARVAAPDPSSVERVLFRFKPLSAELGEQFMDGAWAPDVGAYVVSNPLTLAGQWQAIVSVRRTGVLDDVRVTFNFWAS